MTRWAPQRRDTLDAIAGELLQHYAKGRAIVAVDGPAGVGATRFADDLVRAFAERGHAAFAAPIDGFLRPRADRLARGVDSAEGRYEDAFDYSAFRRALVEPFRTGEGAGFVTAAFDVARDAPVQPTWRSGPRDAILVVSGVFLNRPELRGVWNASIRLDLDPADALARARAADVDASAGASDDAALGADARYVAEADPRRTATIIVDMTDEEHPRQVFADAC
jgi:uridine kinase